MKNKWFIIISAIMLFCCTGCGTKSHTEGELDGIKYQETDQVTNYVKIEMKSGDIMIAQLYPDVAPITVANYQKLVSEKFYDGLTFHRIIKNFMIQGGDPNGDGTGGSAETIKGEFEQNGVENNLSHERGVLSMARKNKPMDSASSQFFICHADVTDLDGAYATFGKLIAGYDTLDKLADTKVKSDGETPVNKPKILSIRFVTIEEENKNA